LREAVLKAVFHVLAQPHRVEAGMLLEETQYRADVGAISRLGLSEVGGACSASRLLVKKQLSVTEQALIKTM